MITYSDAKYDSVILEASPTPLPPETTIKERGGKRKRKEKGGKGYRQKNWTINNSRY